MTIFHIFEEIARRGRLIESEFGGTMRGLIKASAGLFILLGGLAFATACVAALGSLSKGAASPYATYPEIIALIVALGGLLGGASLVLVGGTAYLLTSIDERIEGAMSKGLRQATPRDLAPAE
jgi:hypothetical protein